MRKILIFFLCISLYPGCGNQNQSTTEIRQLEKTMEDEPGRQNAIALIQAYVQEAGKQEDIQKQAEYYEKALQLAIDQKIYGRAMGLLQMLILDYPDPEKRIGRLTRISRIFSDMKRQAANSVLLRAMKETYPEDPVVNELLSTNEVAGISSDSLLNSLGTRMFNDSLLQLNKNVAREYVDACEAYALVKQDDPSGAEYLHKGAETARSLQTLDKALFLYDWIIEQYPDHPRAAQALFLKAFTIDNDLKKYEDARVLYEEFLEKYPRNEFVPSAEFLLENLGKSDEELLESLQSRSREVN